VGWILEVGAADLTVEQALPLAFSFFSFFLPELPRQTQNITVNLRYRVPVFHVKRGAK
jgi:hypothetical protein